MISRLIAIFALTFTSAFCEDGFDRTRLLSADESIRGEAFRELQEKGAVLSDADCLFLIERAGDPRTSREESTFLLQTVFVAITTPPLDAIPFKKQQLLSLQAGEPLLKIIESDMLSLDQRVTAIWCLCHTFDGSEKANEFEDRMFHLLSKDESGDIRCAVANAFRCFPLKKNDNTWKWFVSVLNGERGDEDVRRCLIEAIDRMAFPNLIVKSDFYDLMEIAFNAKCNSDKMKIRILSSLGKYHSMNRISELPDWCIKAMGDDFIHRECTVEYKVKLANSLARNGTDKIEVVNEAIRLSFDKTTDRKLHKACLRLIRGSQVTDSEFSNALDGYPDNPSE